MPTFQTMLYQGEKLDEPFGWKLGKIFLFETAPHPNAIAAMEEFNKFPLPDAPWFAYIRVTENNKIIDEEMVDSFCYETIF